MKNTLFVFIVILITSLYSCTSRRYIYSASPANNPYFSKKGQSQLTAAYSSSGGDKDVSAGGSAHGFDMQGAYSIADHWAITSEYFNRKEKDVYNYYSYNSPFDSSVVTYSRNIFDIGAGYFLPLDQRKDIVLNVYGSVGFGKFSFDDNGTMNSAAYTRYHSSSITRWTFQPAVNFTTGGHFRCALILRSSFVHYGNIKTSYTINELQNFSLDRITNRTLYFFEPGVNLQFGFPKYPWIKFDMSLTSVSHAEQDLLGVRTGNTSIGLSFDLFAAKKK